jgi:hypothetical protein
MGTENIWTKFCFMSLFILSVSLLANIMIYFFLISALTFHFAHKTAICHNPLIHNFKGNKKNLDRSLIDQYVCYVFTKI